MAALIEGTVGTNITYGNDVRVWKEVLNLLNRKMNEGPRGRKVCTKAGAPVTDAVADNPRKLYDLCWDTSGGEVYMCTKYSIDASDTIWTRITDV